LAPVVLYRTLGPTLPDGADAAALLWGAAHKCAQQFPAAVAAAGYADGEALFDAILASPSGLVFSVDDYDASWSRVRTDDGRINLVIDELLDELRGLATEPAPATDPEFPFVLAAGERRSFTANTIFRNPAWRKRDTDGALRLSVADGERLGVATGDKVVLTTKRGSAVAVAELDESMQAGHAALPNGLGLDYPDGEGGGGVTGVAPNELTASEDRDWIAGTPWHKHVAARIEPLDRARVEPAS
jgi:anaerobic selenocysteine-containing dehydrogenase